MSSELDILNELRPFLVRQAKRYSSDPGVQQDLAQEGWVAAWRALQKDGTGKNPISYARYAAVWKMKDVLRKSYPEPIDDINISESESVTAEFAELAYHHGEIHRALQELSEKQREFLRLRFWEGFSPTEARRVVGHDAWKNAKEKLRSRLQHLKEYS
jgi:RNA polymerase sigma factor (sigma-70 family)